MIGLLNHPERNYLPLTGKLFLAKIRIGTDDPIIAIMYIAGSYIFDTIFIYNKEQERGIGTTVCDLNKIDTYLFSNDKSVRDAVKEVIEQLPIVMQEIYENFEIWKDLK